MWTKYDNEIEALFCELVPPSGKCESKAGELVRALNKIVYRFFNDGDRINVGYGKETCNPSARFLLEEGDSDVHDAVPDLWGLRSDRLYEMALDVLAEAVIKMVEKYPELRNEPTKDMYDYTDPDEDVDDYEDYDYDEI